MLRFRVNQVFPDGKLNACFDDEPEPRKWFLYDFIDDLDGQEDLYLAAIARAEAGETITDLYNHYVHAYLYPNQVVLESMSDDEVDGAEVLGPRNCTRLSLAEAKQLILDWLEAKEKWYAQNDATTASAAAGGSPVKTA